MNLKEQLAEKKAALKALEENIKAGEEEAIAQGEEIAGAIEEIEKSIESAEKASALLAQIGNTEESQEDGTVEENGIKSMNLEYLKNNRGAVQTYIKAATDPVTGPTIPYVSQNVAEIQYKLGVRDLFSTEAISGNSYTYFRMGATDLPTGFDGTTAQGAEKPQIHRSGRAHV